MRYLLRCAAVLSLVIAACTSGDVADAPSAITPESTTATTAAITWTVPSRPTTTTSAPAPAPATPLDWISFVAPCEECADEGTDVFVIRSDGTELALLAHFDGPIADPPVWSPDGSYLAVQIPDIYAVTLLEIADFSVRNRVELEGSCWLPVWSADGESFATHCDLGNETYLVLGSAGSRVSFEDYPLGNVLAWLPDDRVLFASSHAGAWDFYTAGLQDQAPARITDYNWPQQPSFAVSPDGGQVAFTLRGVDEIMVMGVDGSGLTSVSVEGSTHAGSGVSWSPDGSRLGFITTADADDNPWAVSVMNADGTGLVNVSAGSTCVPYELEWSPNGDWVAFMGRESPDSPDWVTYIVRPTGNDLTDLATALGLDVDIYGFSWAPDGSHIAIAVTPGTSATMAAIEALGWEGWRDAFGDEYFGIYVAQADGNEFTQISVYGELLGFVPSQG